MSVLKRLRVLARYHVLTPVAVLSALAAGPSVAADKINPAGSTVGSQAVDTGFGYINDGTINGQLSSTGAVAAVLNRGNIINSAARAVSLGGTVTSFNNSGTIRGQTLGMSITGTVDSFANFGSITGLSNVGASLGPVGSFINGGRIASTTTYGVAVGATTSFENLESGTIIGGVNFGGVMTSFINRGTITTDSAGLAGINANSVHVVYALNAGSIASLGDAVFFSGGIENFVNAGVLRGDAHSFNAINTNNDKVTALTGSEFYGLLNFGSGTDIFDFSGFYGTAVLTTTGLETLIAGNRAFVASGGNTTIRIYDQTGAASMGSVASSTAGSIQTAIANELGGFSAGNILDSAAVSGYVAQRQPTPAEAAANEAVLSEIDVTEPSRGKIWGTAFGGFSTDAMPVSLTNIYGGIVAGSHYQLDAQTRLGGLVSYARSSFNVANGQQVIDTQTGTLGVYGNTDLGIVELSYSLIGGGSSHSSSRKVVVGMALENATASFSSWFINPGLGVSVPVLSDDTHTVNLAASASYIYGGVAGYTERSANFSAVVGAMPIGVFEARFEVNGEKIVGTTETGEIRARGKAGVLGQVNLGSSNIPLTLNGTATSFANPGSTGLGVYAGSGLTADIGANLVLDTGIDVTYRADGTVSGAAKIGLIGSF